MPTVIYQNDRSQSQTQRTQTKFGNELTGKRTTTIHPKGSQAHTGIEPMQTPDIWSSFTPTKKDTI
jgi:hypothetical protein